MEKGHSNDEIAKKLDISYGTVRSHKKIINKKMNDQNFTMSDDEKFTTDFKEESGTINSLTYRLQTVDQVIEFAKIDLDVWEVERVKTNYYEMGRKDKTVDMSWEKGVASGKVKDSGGWNTNKLWQISIWFKKKVKSPVDEALKAIEKRLENTVPHFLDSKRKPYFDNPHMLEVSVSDSHFGKLAVNGDGLEQTISIYSSAIDNILAKIGNYDIDKILLPLGSDFFHINNFENTTKKGTRQDISHHIFDIYDKGCEAIVNMVYQLKYIAPVEIVWVPGNHDFETSRYLCTWLQAWFRNDVGINVRIGKNPRKYVKYGSTLLGLTHGNEEKHIDLPNLMMTENRKNISDVEFFEWHIGHFHRAKEMKFVSNDTIGHIPIKTLPSLSGTDYWHLSKGFLSNRIVESYLYNYKFGPSGYFITNLQELKY